MQKSTPVVGARRPKSPIYAQKSGVIEYYAYRDYDAASGRWCTPDPIAEQGGSNLYANSFNEWRRDIDRLEDPGPFSIAAPIPAPKPQPEVDDWYLLLAGALAAGATALVAGQAGPQVLAPEEFVTVPLAGLIGGLVALWGHRNDKSGHQPRHASGFA